MSVKPGKAEVAYSMYVLNRLHNYIRNMFLHSHYLKTSNNSTIYKYIYFQPGNKKKKRSSSKGQQQSLTVKMANDNENEFKKHSNNPTNNDPLLSSDANGRLHSVVIGSSSDASTLQLKNDGQGNISARSCNR